MATSTNPNIIGTSSPPAYATRIDEVSTAVTYIAKANVGSLDAGAVWQIMRLTTTGTETAIEYADGDLLFDNVWDDRASLTYS